MPITSLQQVTQCLLSSCNDITHNLITLLRIIKHIPSLLRNMLECLLESGRLILLIDSNRCNIIYTADQDEFNPAFVFTVTNTLLAQKSVDDGTQRTYISPYDSGSACVESPINIIFLFGSQPLTFSILSTL